MDFQRVTVEHAAFVVRRAEHPAHYEADCYHDHPGYELYYQLTGARRFCLQAGDVLVTAGSLVLVGPGQAHKTIPADDAPARYLTVHFTAQYLAALQQAIPQVPLAAFLDQTGRRPVALTPEQPGLLLSVLERLHQWQREPGPYAAARCQIWLAGLLLELQPLYKRSAAVRRGCAAQQMAPRIRLYVESHLQQPIRLTDLARYLGVTPGYVSRLFSAATGQSFVEYVHGVRVRAACALLQQSGGAMLTREIVQRCGFGTAAAFRRAFKQVMGVTPSVYRRRCRQPNGLAET